ncbi:CoA transferase [Epidermidibacterium keratini]|uniref:CoA transferase n=1 Tax=Epidermidibacterium keratini TaxID=1891644 RepID=A0A7L4YN48_9ACTN|nr:CoA transferase [Epidermidibacterium keratini]QHC00313.1 CoA transferase [Epidermidibacterium keratini]
MNRGPLDGVRVLDLTRVVMGPYATQILADQGAEVIIIEDAHGDTNRVMGGGPHDELSGVAMNLLRNKKSVSLDLKTADGQAAALEIAATCDVVVATMRPQALEKLGVSYEHIRAVRPDVIYCQGQGYPLDSEMRDAPAYDDVIQAASGVADLTRQVYDEAYLLPTIFADKVGGLFMAQAVSAALFQRERTGEGAHIELAMTRATSSFLLVEHGSRAIGEPPQGPAGYQRIMTKERRPHPTKDGMIHLLPYQPKHYDALFAEVGWPEFADRSRWENRRASLANSDSLYRDVRRVMATRTTAEWLEFCRAASIPATPVTTIQDLVDELPLAEHPAAGRYRVTPVAARFNGTDIPEPTPAPLIGQDTADVLDDVRGGSPHGD